MQEEFPLRSRGLPRRSGISGRAMFGTLLLAFIGGALLVGWLVRDGRIALDRPEKPVPQFADMASSQVAPSAALPAQPAGALDQRLAAMEQRLARIDLQSAASEGNSSRAEALLIALAARRAIERGVPLGYLEEQLKLRFSDAQPTAVQTVVGAARVPTTLELLSGQLEALSAQLIGSPVDESGWDRFTREISGLFVIRRDSAPSSQPALRLERAKLLLSSRQFDQAAAEVERLPGAAAAKNWIAAARQHGAALQALDLIETTALLDPTRLNSREGKPVVQPSPLTPGAAPAPSLNL